MGEPISMGQGYGQTDVSKRSEDPMYSQRELDVSARGRTGWEPRLSGRGGPELATLHYRTRFGLLGR